MTLKEMGFMYAGHCACPGKPERWAGDKKMELKQWKDGRWKLLRSGMMVRYGYDPASIDNEVTEYMTKNNLL
jgi:hypothetical protein